MKRIGILFGGERSFPLALAARIGELGGDVVAEPVQVGGVGLETSRRYDLVLDRASHEIPFYRSLLKKWIVDGTIVVNNPFWWSADDRYFGSVIARELGIAVPRTVLLPSHDRPPGTTADAFANLDFPLDWPAIFDHVGFPARLRASASGSPTDAVRVASPEEFFDAYANSGQAVSMLQQEIAGERAFECLVVGRELVRVMPRDGADDDPELVTRIGRDSLLIARALGYDLGALGFSVQERVPYLIETLDPGPDADPETMGARDRRWLVDTLSRWLVDRVQRGPEPGAELTWGRFLAGGTAAADRRQPPRPTSPLPSAGIGRRAR